MPPRTNARRAVPTPAERAQRKLKEMGDQALALGRGQPCVWTAAQVGEATQAVRELSDSSVWTAVPIEGRAGLAAIFALALRRSGPQEGGSEGLRAAYADLRHQLAQGLGDLQCGESGDDGPTLPPAPSRQLCLALLEGDACPAYAALLHAASSTLQSQKPHPPRRSLQAAKDLLVEVDHVLSWVDRVNTAHKSGPSAATGRGAGAPDKFDRAVDSVCTSSLVWEHWARLILVLAGIEGAEDTAALEADRLGIVLTDMRTSGGSEPYFSEPPVGLGLPFLLISHLANLSAALDGGPTLGLPAGAASAGGAGPSGSGGDPSAALFMPLADKEGRRLQLGPRRPPGASPANIDLAIAALEVWGTALNGVVVDELLYKISVAALPERLRPPPPPPPPLLTVAGFAPSMCARARELAAALEAAARAWSQEPESGAVAQALQTLEQGKLGRCVKLQAALQRGDLLFNWAAAFEVGMRLAGAAAVQLCRLGAFAETEASLRSLYAPSAWRPVQGPPPLGAASPPARPHGGARLLTKADAVTLATRGMGLARNALAAPRNVYDPGQGFQGRPPAWLRRRLGAWWRAMLAWAQHGPTDFHAAELMQLPARCYEDGLPARPSINVAALLSAGYLPAVERMYRHPPSGRKIDWLLPIKAAALSSWSEALAFAEPSQALALVATASKKATAAQGVRFQDDSSDRLASVEVALKACHSALPFGPGAGLAHALVRYPGAAPVPEQWPMVMSFAAVRLLEPLASVLEQAAAVLLPSSRDEASKSARSLLVELASHLLAWVPSLVAAGFVLPPKAIPAEERPIAGPAGLEPAGGTGAEERATTAVAAGPAAAPAGGSEPSAAVGPARSSGPAGLEELPPAAAGAAERVAAGAAGAAWTLKADADWAKMVTGKIPLDDLVSIALDLASAASGNEGELQELRQPLLAALWALGARARVLVTAWWAVDALAGPQLGHKDAQSLEPAACALLAKMRRVLGPGGPLPEPALLAQFEHIPGPILGESASAAARAGGAAATGGSPSGGFNQNTWPEEVRRYAAAPSLLLPYKQARALLPGCANPGCTNLSGSSEVDLPLPETGGDESGAASFCRPQCLCAFLAGQQLAAAMREAVTGPSLRAWLSLQAKEMCGKDGV